MKSNLFILYEVASQTYCIWEVVGIAPKKKQREQIIPQKVALPFQNNYRLGINELKFQVDQSDERIDWRDLWINILGK